MRKYFYLFVLIGLLTLLFSGCEKEENKSTPILSTLQVKEITQTTALSGGNITDDRGAIVTTRGVCWSTGQTPTVNDNKTLDGTGAGDFTSEISGLEPNTTYYLRAYATNSAGTNYGSTMSFTTLEEIKLSTITTVEVSEITQTTALAGGIITFDGGASITARGVCWSSGQTPTVNDNKTLDGTGAGDFTSEISGLEPNTTYYVRAYATNSAGTEYGDQIEFKTLENLWKLANEAQFVTISGNSEYQRLSSHSGNGYIMYKVIEEGDSNGETPLFTDRVKVLYTGWYKNIWSMPDIYTDDKGNQIYNKIVFDSTENRNNIPSTFFVNPNASSGSVFGVIDGFSTALQYMHIGDKWEVWIPWKLGYGESGSGSIPAYTTLVFEIELVDIL